MLLETIQVMGGLAPTLVRLYSVLLVLLVTAVFFGNQPYWYGQAGLTLVGEGVSVAGTPIHEAAPITILGVSIVWHVLQWPVRLILAWMTRIVCLGMDVAIGSWAGVFGFTVPDWCGAAGYTAEHTAAKVDFGDLITDAVDPLLEPLESAIGSVKNAVKSVGSGVKSAGKAVSSTATSAYDSVVDFFSDRRIKRDIVLVGHTPSGLPLYEFKFVEGMGFDAKTTYRGVMAQDLLDLGRADAVTVPPRGGYMKVDYTKIDADLVAL